ncbi:hypothetical protein [Deinococcus budaensis]|uniref:Uncharacterized protein n=1 Tax=Deinococcus budaensis TaxID=1665626 RepID=A0A7W8LRY1_9DEIO|nr:hypothetical protein [Deinococcus budaensis]MBB5236077.1 hypothetical protein [Deinococcus budaensis]
MRPLLLSALLLAAPALVPAAGAQAAWTLAQTQAAPARAAVLTLSAPVGASVELNTQTTTRLEVEDVQVSGGNAQEAARTRADLTRLFGAQGPQRVSGKAFYRVQSRGADGRAVLLNTVVVALPGQGDVNIRILQTLRPDGALTDLRIESDNPALQQVFGSLKPEILRQQLGQGGGLEGFYGRPLVPGQARTATATVDMQALLAGLFGGLGAALGEGPAAFANVQASPLTGRTTTTYRGLNAARQHVFDTTTTFGDWAISVRGQGEAAALSFRAELLSQGSRMTTTNLFRADGLPVGGSAAQIMRMRVTMTEPGGQQVQLTYRMTTEATLRAR